MSLSETIQKGLDKKNGELTRIRERLQKIQVWLEGAAFMQSQELFVASVKERDELRHEEIRLTAQIPLLEWMLKLLGQENKA